MSVKPSSNSDESEQRLPSKIIMPLLALQRHWQKSLILFIVIVGVGLPLAWQKGTSTFYAEAVIQVNFRYAPNLQTVQEIETHSNTQYDRLVSQQIRTITRFDVIKRALDGEIDEEGGKIISPSIWHLWKQPDESQRKAAQRLMGALRIIAVHDTYLVTVGLEDKDPSIIAPLVNAIVKSYIRAAKDETFFGEKTRLTNLRTRRDEINEKIDERSSELKVIADQLGLTTFEEGLQNPYDRILVDMESALVAARRQRVTAEAELEAMLGKHERLLKLSLDAEAQKLTASDRALGDLRAYLYQRRAQLVQTMSGLKPSHEGRQAAEREIEQINEEITQSTSDKVAEMKSILEERRLAEMRAEVAEYEAKLDEARQVEAALQVRVDERSEQVKDFMEAYNEGFGIQEEIERQRRQLNLVLDRIDAITIERDAPGYVRLVSAAEPPEEPYTGGRKKLFILFVVAATGAALILPLALEFIDTRIRTPVDLHRILGFEPNAWLPEIVNEDARALFNQQAERLAVSVLRDLEAQGMKRSFFITEMLPGAGKTLITYELADNLQRLGVSTLALSADPKNEVTLSNLSKGDSDATAPTRDGDDALELAFLTGVIPGLVEVMGKEVDLDQAIVRRGDNEADWLGFGDYAKADRTDNVLRFKEVLDELTKLYDLVLVDGPSILTSAKAEAIVGICYGTLIVVNSIQTNPKQLKRALAIIERASPELVGAVLNKAPLFKRSGYFLQLAATLARQSESHNRETKG